MGVAGAAWATVIGQIAAGILGLILNLIYNKEIRLSLKNLIPKLALIKEILVIAIPSVLMQAIGSVMTFAMNKILIGFETVAMNVFGVYFKIQSFVFMPIFGLTSGMVPIVAYNYGARRTERVFATVKLSTVISVSYMALGCLVFQTIPSLLLSMFNATPEMLEIGRVALRVISISFVLAGVGIICSVTCQALGQSIYSMLISAGRQLVVLIPAAYLLSLTGRVDAVWWAFPIAEVVSLIIAVYFLIKVLKKCFPKENAIKCQ
jgi:Na+-driven multidrug efflux pump